MEIASQILLAVVVLFVQGLLAALAYWTTWRDRFQWRHVLFGPFILGCLIFGTVPPRFMRPAPRHERFNQIRRGEWQPMSR